MRETRGRGLRWVAAALAALVWLPVARAEDSWQIWLDQAADTSLAEKSTIRAAQSFRFACNDGALSTYYLEAGYVRNVRAWLDMGLAYRQQYDRREGRWMEENRPYADVTVLWRTQRVTLSDRSRLEYRMRDEQSETFRYRNKLALQYKDWEPAFGLKPYVAAEAFVDESGTLKERDQTRFTLGIRTDPERAILRKLAPREGRVLSMDYYVAEQRTRKSGEWTNAYIAGVQFGVHF